MAGLTDAPREIRTEQLVVGTVRLVVPDDREANDAETLPFFLIAENRVKRVCLPEYLETQEKLTNDLEEEDGYRARMLLRDVEDQGHFFVVDEWQTERHAFEAFERRQNAVSEIDMTRFLALLQERGELDFTLGIHG